MRNLFFKYFLFFLLISNCVWSKDFGKFGNTFSIEEEDLLEVIQEKMETIDIETWKENFKKKSLETAMRPKGYKLPYAKEYKISYFDPKIILQKDYSDDKGRIFARKGTVINPLNNVSLLEKLIFIDGDNREQVNFALNEYKTNNEKVKIILINGSPIELMKEKKVRFYFDQGKILFNKFNFQNIPAIVSQKDKVLKIEEIVLKYEN